MTRKRKAPEPLELPELDVTLPEVDITLPELVDLTPLPDLSLFDDLPWNEPEPGEETGDSTARAIVESMSREERERAIGVSPDIARWFASLLTLPKPERETAVRRMCPYDREKFHRWRMIA